MRVAVVLVVAVVMVTTVEGWGWRAPRINLPRFNLPRIPLPRIRFPRTIPIPIPGFPVSIDLRDAEKDADFKVAAEDGILSDDEIKSVLGVAEKDLDEFKSLYDVNENGEITIDEYQAVTIITEKAKGEGE